MLVIHATGFGTHTERFVSAIAFQRRLEALEQQLEREHWQRTAQPVLLRDGWKL